MELFSVCITTEFGQGDVCIQSVLLISHCCLFKKLQKSLTLYYILQLYLALTRIMQVKQQYLSNLVI